MPRSPALQRSQRPSLSIRGIPLNTLSRVIIGAALLLALHLGQKMKAGKRGRGSITSPKGLTFFRTVLVALLAPTLLLDLVGATPDLLTCQVSGTLAGGGLLAFVLGMAMRVWSQVILGNQWSADLSVLKDHQLVTAGPYRWCRHPIYASYLLIAPGLFLSTGNWPVGVISLGYVALSLLRIPDEEAMLRQKFGSEYYAYANATARMVPAAIALLPILVANAVGIGMELSWIFQ